MINLVIAIISLLVATIIGYCQIKQGQRMEAFEKRQDERDEERRNDEIYAEATRFIQKYNKGNHKSEIYLLPLCIAAYQYDPVYPYRRKIYREFCGLPEKVQNSILTRSNIDIPCNKIEHFFPSCVSEIEEEFNKYRPNDQSIFYNSGKYLKNALHNHGAEEIPNIRCAIDEEERLLNDYLVAKHLKSASRNDMDYRDHIYNLLISETEQKPVSKLLKEATSLGVPVAGPEILICYLSCIIAERIPHYLRCDNNEEGDNKNVGFVDDYMGTKYMEDLFLEALHSISVYGVNFNKSDSCH